MLWFSQNQLETMLWQIPLSFLLVVCGDKQLPIGYNSKRFSTTGKEVVAGLRALAAATEEMLATDTQTLEL